MPRKIAVLCDERDAEVAESLRKTLESRGLSPRVVVCDASADALDRATREALSGASQIVVVLREGGRGTRLLRAVEDDARGSAEVLSLLADASLGSVVSARTAARIQTLGDSVVAAANEGGGSSSAREASKKWPFFAAAIAIVMLITSLVFLRFWPTLVVPATEPPVAISGMMSSGGWLLTFHLREEARTLEYKRPSDTDYISTGQALPGFGPRGTVPRALMSVGVMDLRGRVPFSVRYTTLEGAERGPYEVVFDTTKEAVSSVKNVLTLVPEWISFRSFNGRMLCYFSTLLVYKYALREIRYGFDNAPATRRLGFVPSDAPGINNEDQLYIELPDDTSSVTVELVFLDDTTEGPKRFLTPSGGQ